LAPNACPNKTVVCRILKDAPLFPRLLYDEDGIGTETGTLLCNISKLLSASVDVTEARKEEPDAGRNP
jgi:hypothetical protein